MEPKQVLLNSQYRVIGFSNPSNCCFVNSAMQIVKTIGALQNISSEHRGESILKSLQEVCVNSRLMEPKSAFWRLLELYLGYTPRAIRQNCACEFLRFFLTQLDEELEGLYTRVHVDEDNEWVEVGQRNQSQSFNFRAKGKSILYDLLGLGFKTEARAKGHSSMTYQEELIISVQAENKLTQALDNYFSYTKIESFMVDGVPTSCKAKTWISSFRPYLILHIQRFRVDNGNVVKVKKFIEYPKILKIPLRCLSPSLKMLVENGNCLAPDYELKGIIEHHGESANSGHYTAVVNNAGAWLHVDDQVVRPVSVDFVRNRIAYVLLYQQVNRECL
jgi:ubiquitin C-terminal hydrolase